MAEQKLDVRIYSLMCLKDLSDHYLEILLKIPEDEKFKEIRDELQTVFNRGHNSILCSYDLKAVSHAYIAACYDLALFWKEYSKPKDKEIENYDTKLKNEMTAIWNCIPEYNKPKINDSFTVQQAKIDVINDDFKTDFTLYNPLKNIEGFDLNTYNKIKQDTAQTRYFNNISLSNIESSEEKLGYSFPWLKGGQYVNNLEIHENKIEDNKEEKLNFLNKDFGEHYQDQLAKQGRKYHEFTRQD